MSIETSLLSVIAVSLAIIAQCLLYLVFNIDFDHIYNNIERITRSIEIIDTAANDIIPKMDTLNKEVSSISSAVSIECNEIKEAIKKMEQK